MIIIEINEESIKINACDIILGIDDIITNSQREDTNLNLIKQNLKMDSQEEKAFNKNKKKKEEKAKDDMVKKMNEIEQMKKNNTYVNNSVSRFIIYCKIISEMIEEKERQIEIQRKGLKLKREQEERVNQEMGIF